MKTQTTASRNRAIDDYWSGRAHAYHRHQVTGERAQLDRELWTAVFTDAIRPGRGVLDVGTGSGYVANLLAANFTVTGIDRSPGMIEQARGHNGNAEFLIGDAVNVRSALPEDARFDAITSRYLLWTLPDPVAAIREWMSVLRPGGRVIAVDAPWFPHGIDDSMLVETPDGPDAFLRTYNPDTLATLPLATATDASPYVEAFEKAGLYDVSLTPLPQVTDLDRTFGVAPGHESRPHFLVTGIVRDPS